MWQAPARLTPWLLQKPLSSTLPSKSLAIVFDRYFKAGVGHHPASFCATPIVEPSGILGCHSVFFIKDLRFLEESTPSKLATMIFNFANQNFYVTT